MNDSTIRRIAPSKLAIALLVGLLPTVGLCQENITLKSAVVALIDDVEQRRSFEEGLVRKARPYDYGAVTSYDIVPDAADLDSRGFGRKLAEQGVRVVLMIRPAAIGPGATLQSVQNEVSPEVLSDMRAFAGEVSPSGDDDLFAVVHLAIYRLDGKDAEPISAGAVWLDEEVETREQGIERLQDLIISNVNAVRPQIREQLGMPPLQ